MTVKNTRHFAGGKEISVATEVMDMTSVSRRLWPLYPWGYDLCFPEVMTSVSQRLWPLYPRGYDLCFPEVMKSVSRRLWPLFPGGYDLCFPEGITSVSQRLWPLFLRDYDRCIPEVMTSVWRGPGKGHHTSGRPATLSTQPSYSFLPPCLALSFLAICIHTTCSLHRNTLLHIG